MCGLYRLKSAPAEVRRLFGYCDEPRFPPREHVAPREPIPIVRLQGLQRRFALALWGLVPSWAKAFEPGKALINARAETVLVKASFRHAMLRRRCLVPADGFYEWHGVPGRKQPYLVRRQDDRLFAFAGLWEEWMGADGSEIETAAILTTTANATLAPIHPRMPVVIAPHDFAAWLDVDGVEPEDAARLLRPAPEDFLLAEPVELRRAAPPPRAPAGAEPAQAPEQPKLL
jgi:putative SOS response-associated peptidase YedK